MLGGSKQVQQSQQAATHTNFKCQLTQTYINDFEFSTSIMYFLCIKYKKN